MPAMFTAAIVFAVLAAIAALVYLPIRKWRTSAPSNLTEGEAKGLRVTAQLTTYTLTAMACLLFVLSCTVIVSTKNVGVVTSFGEPKRSEDNGFHLKWPWEKVTELDAAVQTDTHAGTGQDDKDPCTTVRIANQTTACADNSIRWRIKQESADELFRDYRSFEKIRDSLVTRQLQAALNTVFKGYDPLARDAEGNSLTPSQDDLSKSTRDTLRGMIGDDVEVLDVFVPVVHFDDATQRRINDLQAEIANTRIATQRQQTADAEAEANRRLAASISNDPNVLVSRCLESLEGMIKAGQPVPPAFSCWPGGAGGVVLPAPGR